VAVSQAEKRRQILDAAVRAFARKGYHACRVGEIAEEAGVAYGLVYHYFSSKEEVLQTIFRDTWTLMLARIAEMEADGDPASEQVRKVTALLLRTWKRDPDLVRVLVREVTRSPEQLQHEIEEIGHAYEALERMFRGLVGYRRAAVLGFAVLRPYFLMNASTASYAKSS